MTETLPRRAAAIERPTKADILSAGPVPSDSAASRNLASGAVFVFRHFGLALALLVLVTAFAWAVAPTFFTSSLPDEGVTADRLLPPSAAHWFGTDNLGRDLYTRTVHAASLSLVATSVAVAIAVVGGTILGVVAGYFGGRVDIAISRVIDVLLAVPGLLLAMAIVAALGFGTVNVAIAVGLGAIARFTRVARAEVIRVRTYDFIEAGLGSGLTSFSVLRKHVLPNSIGPIFALTIIEFGGAILAVSALSFLGYGAQPPTPEWGSLVAEGRNYISKSWWLITFPGLVVVAVVLSTNAIASALGARNRARGGAS